MFGSKKDSAGYSSYQQGGSYIPPGKTYAEQQTNMVRDTVKTQYDVEGTAASVLNQMHQQRQQLQGARDNVEDMQVATESAKRELTELATKYKRKRRRLYFVIFVLAVVDIALLVRIIMCHGSFFC